VTVLGPRGAIVFVGMMATGKTTVGRAVAARLGRDFYDSDSMIEADTGKTVAELWRSGGEAAFRALETEALDDALVAEPAGVIAAAGGVVLSAANRARLQRASEDGAVVVWLRADPAVLAERVRPGDHRPLLATNPVGTLTRLAAERETLYAEVADRTIDVDRMDVGRVVAAALDEIDAYHRTRS